MRRGIVSIARRAVPSAVRVTSRSAVVRPAVYAQSRLFATKSKEDTDLEKKIRDVDAKVLEAEAAMKEDIALPGKVSGKAGEYAAALYRDSVRGKSFEANCSQLAQFAAALDQVDPFVARVFSSKSYAPAECWEALFLLIGDSKLNKFDGLSEIAQTAIVEDEFNMKKFQDARKLFGAITIGDDVGRMLGGLCEAGRLDLFSKTKERYFGLVKAAGNAVDVKVVSAIALSAAQVKKVEGILPNFLEGQNAITTYEVDPDVLGGVKIQVGNTLADASSDGVLRQVSQTFQ